MYVYLDPRKPEEYSYDNFRFEYEPFYVGKGCNNRYKWWLRNNIKWHNLHFRNKIMAIRKSKGEPIIEKVVENLSNDEASGVEMTLINGFGRRDLGTGVLCNLTAGGDGSSGRIVSEEVRRKISEGNKGKSRNVGKNHLRYGKSNTLEQKRKISEATSGEKNHNYGKPMRDESKEKMRKALCGRKLSEEHKRNIRIGIKGRIHKLGCMCCCCRNKRGEQIVSEEIRKKQSDARKRWWKQRRATTSD